MIRKILAYEPVMSVAFFAALLAATANVLREFGVYDLSDEQITAVLSVLTALAPVVGFFVRQEVTPVVKL